MNDQDSRPYRNRMFRLAGFDGPDDDDDDDDDIVFVSRKSPSPRRSTRTARLRQPRTFRSNRARTPPVTAVVELDDTVDVLNTLLAEYPDEPSTSTGITSSFVCPTESDAINDQESWEDMKKFMSRLVEESGVVVPEVKEEQEAVRITCPICLETPTSLMATMCGHVFCEGCLMEVVQLPKACCPTCRQRITKKKVHPLYL